MNELSLEGLLGNVVRSTGWIITGGSAQFRHGAVSELQANLQMVNRKARAERVLLYVNVLDVKATRVAANKTTDAESVLGLRRVLVEFEQAMSAYLAAAGARKCG